MTDVRPFLVILTLNINELNILTGRLRLAELIKKSISHLCCLQETHFTNKDVYRHKVNNWKNIKQTNRNKKQAGIAILISDKRL